MRELTFCGYLRKYVRAMSNADSCGLYPLAREAVSTNLRLREPLFLYALFSGKENVLMSATKDEDLRHEYSLLLEKYDRNQMEKALIDYDESIPERYQRVYRSYLAARNRNLVENDVKAAMHSHILELKQAKCISAYRIYTDLGYNPSNLNAFIKHGDCSKLSLQKVRSVLHYLEAAPASATCTV